MHTQEWWHPALMACVRVVGVCCSGVSTTDSSSDALAGAVMEFLEYLNANAPSSLQASTKFMLRKA